MAVDDEFCWACRRKATQTESRVLTDAKTGEKHEEAVRVCETCAARLPDSMVSTYHDDLLGNAEWLHSEHQFHAALLLAHVALEVYVEDAFLDLFLLHFGELDDDWVTAVPSRTLKDKGTRVLWRLMTGDRVADNKEVWTPYSDAVEVRNRVAHAGKWPTAEEAQASIDAVRAFIAEREKVMMDVRARILSP